MKAKSNLNSMSTMDGPTFLEKVLKINNFYWCSIGTIIEIRINLRERKTIL